jgi:hypothetical protein
VGITLALIRNLWRDACWMKSSGELLHRNAYFTSFCHASYAEVTLWTSVLVLL